MAESATKSGRNDPCPCGSGRKYKRCCLAQERSDDLLWHRQSRLHDTLTPKLLKFAEQALGENAPSEAWDAFWLRADHAPALYEDDDQLSAFFPWFFYDWLPDPHETELDLDSPAANGIAAGYLEQHGERLDPLERQYLQAGLATTFSFHEVIQARPGSGFTLRDLLTDEENNVTEKRASAETQAGDILFARVVRIEHLAVIDGCGPVVMPPEYKESIDELRRFAEAQ